jgi:hypothetical protein
VRSIPVGGCVPYIISQSLEVSKLKKNKKTSKKFGQSIINNIIDVNVKFWYFSKKMKGAEKDIKSKF